MKSLSTQSSHAVKRNWLSSAIVALLAASAFTVSPHADARVFLSVNIAPPLLPVYAQPAIPGPGYEWTPGYWAYGADGYYWVPGAWVSAPYVGALWTPGYWGYTGGVYVFHGGYWGNHVGYYGGINYGFGYTGVGFYGGYWNHGGFYYNRAYNNFGSTRITNVYNRTVNNVTVNHFSFNGPGGVDHRPTAGELAAAHERHVGPTSAQVRQRTLASRDESMRASVNHGTPAMAATARAGEFNRGSEAAATRENANQRELASERNREAVGERERATQAREQASTQRAAERTSQAAQRDEERNAQVIERNANRSRQQGEQAAQRTREAGNDRAAEVRQQQSENRQAATEHRLEQDQHQVRSRAVSQERAANQERVSARSQVRFSQPHAQRAASAHVRYAAQRPAQPRAAREGKQQNSGQDHRDRRGN